MSLIEITRAEFDQFEPQRQPFIELFVEEWQYFKHSEHAVIGLVARDRIDQDWSWVLLGRDLNDRYRAINLGRSEEPAERARKKNWRKALPRRISDWVLNT